MIDQILQHVRDNSLIWLIVMFIGVFYWGVKSRRKAQRDRDNDHHIL